MKTIGNQGMKFLKALHLLSAFLWTGGAFSMMLLILFVKPQEAYGIYTYAYSLKMIDDLLIIVGANGCIITGLLYGIITKWGFFKHRWVAVKWIVTLFMMISGTFAMGPYVNGNVYPIEEVSRYVTDSDTFWDSMLQLKGWGLLQIFLLIFTIVISVYKPWKKKQ